MHMDGANAEAIQLKVKRGIRTSLAEGSLVQDSPLHLATERLYQAAAGSRIFLADKAYCFAVALFAPEIDDRYIYTYAYQKEGNWTRYLKNLTPESYCREEYVFEEDAYFRVCIKRADGKEIGVGEEEHVNASIRFLQIKKEYVEKVYFSEEISRVSEEISRVSEEINRVTEKINKVSEEPRRGFGEDKPGFREKNKISEKKNQDSEESIDLSNGNVLKIGLVADSHYTFGGTWEDTAHNIGRVHDCCGLHMIIHLGDLTDGLLSKEVTAQLAGQMLKDLRECGVPVYPVLGNHDTNYFNNNTEPFTEEEMHDIYGISEWGNKNYYLIDRQEAQMRLVFLTSFDREEPIRYGFSEEEIQWLETVLYTTPKGWKVLVFSHEAPLPELDYWSGAIRGGEEMIRLLERYNALEGNHVMGWFYGHTHADREYYKCSFPLVSVCCSKCEYFLDKKPEGAYVPFRELGTATQDCWDVMLADREKEEIRLLRFGAGEDRLIDCTKRESTWEQERSRDRNARRTKIWAHRGASGLAPENTLKAFELAITFGADGIELDVQMSRDGELVVIHDETIDRTSNGRGCVKDFTLEQLRRFDFNRKHPAYGRLTIPTLAEVYDLIGPTDLTVNVEVKNGVTEYPGIEERVLALTEEKGFLGRVIFSSFNHYSMIRLKRLKPEARIAFLYTSGFMGMAAYARRYGAYALHPDRKGARELWEEDEGEARLHVWAVNDTAGWLELAQKGVAAVITDFPENARKLL